MFYKYANVCIWMKVSTHKYIQEENIYIKLFISIYLDYI